MAQELGEQPASLAHRYALSMSGVDKVVLGVKDRTKLREGLATEAKGPLPADVWRQSMRGSHTAERALAWAEPSRRCPCSHPASPWHGGLGPPLGVGCSTQD
jgi:hypothetical protein